VATRSTGLVFGISDTRDFDGVSIHVNTQFDWSAAFEGLPDEVNNRKALAWDTQTVSLQYFGAGATLDTYLVPGSPYMTLKYTNAAAVFTSLQEDITAFEWVTPGIDIFFKNKSKLVTLLVYFDEYDELFY